MSKQKYLIEFVEGAYLTGDDSSLSEFIKESTRDLYKKWKLQKLDEDTRTKLNEFSPDSPIQLKGDDIYVNGKLVARLISDLDDFDAPITIQSLDGSKKIPVKSPEEAYAWIRKRFLNKGQD